MTRVSSRSQQHSKFCFLYAFCKTIFLRPLHWCNFLFIHLFHHFAFLCAVPYWISWFHFSLRCLLIPLVYFRCIAPPAHFTIRFLCAFCSLTFPRWLAFLRTLISSNSKNFVFLCVLPLFTWSRSLVRSLYQFRELAFSRTHSTFTISRVKLCIVALVFTVFLRAVTLFTDFNVSLFFVLSQGFTVLLPLRYLTNCDLARNNLPPFLK